MQAWKAPEQSVLMTSRGSLPNRPLRSQDSEGWYRCTGRLSSRAGTSPTCCEPAREGLRDGKFGGEDRN